MTDTEKLAATEARLAQVEDELQRHREALTPGPFSNTTVTPQMMERHRQEQSARVPAAIKERQEREAQLAAEREARQLEEGRQRLADYEGQAHQRWLANGGDERSWGSAWPKMRESWLIEESKTDPKERRVQAAMEKLRASGQYGPMG